jgi:hypothetical protein
MDEFGCVQKWIHGNPEEKIKKIYSLSVFDFVKSSYDKYRVYLKLLINQILKTDWYIRIYVDKPDWVAEYKHERIQIIQVEMPLYSGGFLPVMFRYLAMFDRNLDVILFRDIDNIWNEQHEYFVDKWLEGKEEIFAFMNENYFRQEMVGFSGEDVVLGNVYYLSVLSGLWGIRRSGLNLSALLWQRLFAYIETITDFVYDDEYAGLSQYKNRFLYGFDELAMSRVLFPTFINMGLKVYAVPIKIYDEPYIKKLVDDVRMKRFLRGFIAEIDMPEVRHTLLNYWDMESETAGASQYILYVLTNICFRIINKESRLYSADFFINLLKYQIYPVPVLMGIGLFAFHNFRIYNLESAEELVDKFLAGKRLEKSELIKKGYTLKEAEELNNYGI